jgi:hypothetical protein
MSLPVIVTDCTSPLSTCFRNVENAIGASLRWKVVENCQIMTPTTMRTIQNNKLLRVEFKPILLNA